MQLYFSTASISIVLLKMTLVTRQWVWPNWIGLLLSLLVYIATMLLVSLAWPYRGSDDAMFGSGLFWLSMLLVFTLALLPDFVVKYYVRTEMPNNWQLLQEQDVLLGQIGEGMTEVKRLSLDVSTHFLNNAKRRRALPRANACSAAALREKAGMVPSLLIRHQDFFFFLSQLTEFFFCFFFGFFSVTFLL